MKHPTPLIFLHIDRNNLLHLFSYTLIRSPSSICFPSSRLEHPPPLFFLYTYPNSRTQTHLSIFQKTYIKRWSCYIKFNLHQHFTTLASCSYTHLHTKDVNIISYINCASSIFFLPIYYDGDFERPKSVVFACNHTKLLKVNTNMKLDKLIQKNLNKYSAWQFKEGGWSYLSITYISCTRTSKNQVFMYGKSSHKVVSSLTQVLKNSFWSLQQCESIHASISQH